MKKLSTWKKFVQLIKEQTVILILFLLVFGLVVLVTGNYGESEIRFLKHLLKTLPPILLVLNCLSVFGGRFLQHFLKPLAYISTFASQVIFLLTAFLSPEYAVIEITFLIVFPMIFFFGIWGIMNWETMEFKSR